MKIKIIKDYTHRIGPAAMQVFSAGSDVDVPSTTAEQLIKAGIARKPEKKGKANG